MEFIEDFAIIQGTLLTIQRKYGTLKNLSLQGTDGVKIIQAVVDVLKDKICDSNTTESSEEIGDQRLRRILLFLILNTDLSIRDELMEDMNCGHLVSCAPTLSKDLLMGLTWELSLQKYMNEAVAFSPPVLSSELLDMIVTKLNTLTAFLAFPWIIDFLRALYFKMHALQASKNKNYHLPCINSKLFAHYKVLLDKLSKSDANTFKGVDVKTLYRHAGDVTHRLLMLLNTCLQISLYPQEKCTKVLEMYDMTLQFDYTLWNECQMMDGMQFIKVLNNELFSACVRNLGHVTVDLWLYWAECDSVNGGKERSLQNDIAETMFICLDTVREVQQLGIDSVWFKDLVPMLSSMAVKPRNEDDEIKDADIKEILNNVSNKNKSQGKWFKALLKFSNGHAFYDKDCVECIKNNLHLVTFEDVNVIWEHVFHMLSSGADLDENLTESLKNIALDGVKNISLTSQLEVMNTYLMKVNVKPILLTKDFNTNITEVFNKAVNVSDELEDKFISEIICLSLQSPNKVIVMMLDQGFANRKQGTLMVNILKVLRPLRELPGCIPLNGADSPEAVTSCSLVLQLVQAFMVQLDWTDTDEATFMYIVVSLVNESIVDGGLFTNLCLFPVLHTSLVNKSWSRLSLWLQMLHVFVDGTVKGNSTLDKAATLVLMAQVLEVSRQNIFMFSSKAVFVCEESLIVIGFLLEDFLNERTETDKRVQRLQLMLESLLSPINMLYFGKLWYKFRVKPSVNIDWEVFLLHGSSLEESDSEQPTEAGETEETRIMVLATLLQLLPSCTSSEWKNIANCIRKSIAASHENPTFFLFDLFADALLLLSAVVNREFAQENSGSECAISCLDYCTRNFGSLIKDDILPRQKMMPAMSGVIMFQKCVHVLLRLPRLVRESCSSTFMNILVDIMTFALGGVDSTINAVLKDRTEKECGLLRTSVMKDLRASIDFIQDKDTRQGLSMKVMDIIDKLEH